jgi:transposase
MFHRWHVCHGQKRGPFVGPTKRGKGTKLMVLADGAGTPIGVGLASASPAEVTLAESLLATSPLGRLPDRLIGDRGYDSNRLRERLAERGIEPIIPARSLNRRSTHQDGRKLRRYRRRWTIERTNAWLQNFRRLVVRYERKVLLFLALVHMACAMITLKRILG